MEVKDKICDMLESVLKCADAEVSKGIENVDTHELYEVVDIIKDLTEAKYYCSVTEAMEEYDEDDKKWYGGKSRGKYRMSPDMYKAEDPEYYRDMDREQGRMYYTERVNRHPNDGSVVRDSREGRSGVPRKMYMESKQMHKANTAEDKQMKMHDLEVYMNELSKDVTEMIEDSTPEEKQLLKTKMQTLIGKI